MPIKGEGFIITEDGQEIIKDTLEELDYSIDWTKRLAGFSGVIDTSVWTVPNELIVGTGDKVPAIASPFTTIFLSAGSTTIGAKHRVVNTITTVAPKVRTLVQSFLIEMVIR